MTAERTLQDWAATVEAMIFASDKPVPEAEIAQRLPEEMSIESILPLIEKRFDDTGGMELRRIGDAWAFRTRERIAERLNKHKKVERPLSRAATEVLAIIAYHQPVTRAEIEEIRGTSLSRGTIDILLELQWIRPAGRRQTPGRPLTWATTGDFLDHFGLAELGDLPGLDDLKAAGLLQKGQVMGGVEDVSGREAPGGERDADGEEPGMGGDFGQAHEGGDEVVALDADIADVIDVGEASGGAKGDA